MKPSHLLLLSLLPILLTGCDKSAGTAQAPKDPAAAPESSPATGRHLITAPEIKNARVLRQGWSDAEALTFYDKSQGSQMMPYDWFLHLEQADSNTPFRDPANMTALGYLPRSKDNENNKDGLPIGFVKDDTYVGLTCAACHTAQINHKGTAWLIDGGPTLADAGAMMGQLVASLKATREKADKFDRFAKAVQRSDADKLKAELDDLIKERSDYNARNFPAAPKDGFGPGRLDAFDAIYNEVAVHFAHVPAAKTQCDAPVSYPFLWDTPQHDFVQWNGSAANTNIGNFHIGALGRNIGEVLGVFAKVDTKNEMTIPPGGYKSSIRVKKLDELENLLAGLWSPKWPDEAFGKPDAELSKAGEALFEKNCRECHQPINRTDPARLVMAKVRNVHTDQTMAKNAAERESESGVFKGKSVLIPMPGLPLPLPYSIGQSEHISLLLTHLGQRALLGAQLFPNNTILPGYLVKAELNEGNSKLMMTLNALEYRNGKLDKARLKTFTLWKEGMNPLTSGNTALNEIPKLFSEFSKITTEIEGSVAMVKFSDTEGAALTYRYKARPLNGIWATAPYLHNGSVRTLDELLKPSAQREKSFRTGSREFDPTSVGLKDEGPFLFKTDSPGGLNAGHDDYPDKPFNETQRKQLIEYMKTL